jgi:hypothetical protein
MKTNILILVMLFISFVGYSQKKSHFGIKASYISSQTNNKEFNTNVSLSGRRSFSAGLSYNMNLATVLDFQIEALYSRKGYSGLFDYKADFIEIPILVKAHSKGGKIKPFINTGLSPAFNIVDNYNSFKSFDLGFISSIGIDIPINERYTFIEIRYSLGLITNHTPVIMTDNFGIIINQPGQKNNSFYLTTGFFF